MNVRIRRSSFITLIALATLLLALPVQAQSPSNDRSVSEARCERAQTRLALRITRIETAQANRSEAYSSIQTRLDAVIAAASTSEYDTTNLLAAQTALETAVTEFSTELGNHSQSLTSATTLQCSESTSEFVTSLQDARTSLSSVRTAALSVRTIIREQVIPAIQAYSASLESSTTREEQ